jgi:hypothetical protein
MKNKILYLVTGAAFIVLISYFYIDGMAIIPLLFLRLDGKTEYL